MDKYPLLSEDNVCVVSVKILRLGRIKAAKWEYESENKKSHHVTFARTYVAEAKNYNDTESFGRDDLPLVAKLAEQSE